MAHATKRNEWHCEKNCQVAGANYKEMAELKLWLDIEAQDAGGSKVVIHVAPTERTDIDMKHLQGELQNIGLRKYLPSEDGLALQGFGMQQEGASCGIILSATTQAPDVVMEAVNKLVRKLNLSNVKQVLVDLEPPAQDQQQAFVR